MGWQPFWICSSEIWVGASVELSYARRARGFAIKTIGSLYKVGEAWLRGTLFHYLYNLNPRLHHYTMRSVGRLPAPQNIPQEVPFRTIIYLTVSAGHIKRILK